MMTSHLQLVTVLMVLLCIRLSFSVDYSELDTYISSILKCRNILGASLAIVKGSDVHMSRGYGTKISSKTPLPIGSVTQTFTTTLLAKLIDKYTITKR